MLTRIDLDDPGTVATLERQAEPITELNRAELIAMVEPFMSSRVNGKVVNDLSPGRGDQVDRTSPRAWARPARTPG